MIKKNTFAQYCKSKIHPFEHFTQLQEELFGREEFWDLKGRDIFVQGHTSAGKTLIAFAQIWNIRNERTDPKILYVIPYKAVAYQKYDELRSFFPEAAENTIVSTSEFKNDDQSILSGEPQIVVIIYEKVFLFSNLDPSFFCKWDLVILDEFGIIDSKERGIKTDFIFRRVQEQKCRMTVLATPFYDWSAYLQCGDFLEVYSTTRPIEIEEFIISQKNTQNQQSDWNIEKISIQKDNEFSTNQYQEIETNELPIHLDVNEIRYTEMLFQICCKHFIKGHNIIIFQNDREGVRRTVSMLYKYFIEKGVFIEPDEIRSNDFFTDFLGDAEIDSEDLFGLFEDDDNDDILKRALYRGITFHSAAQSHRIRRSIEDGLWGEHAFIQIVAATETLAYGINSNADVVIIYDIRKETGSDRNLLTKNEYKNYIGRAGRYGHTAIGYAYTLVREKDCPAWKDRLNEDSVPLQSNIFKIGEDILPMYILSIFAGEETLSEDQILTYLLEFPSCKEKTSAEEKIEYSEKVHNSMEMLIKHRFVKLDPFSARYKLCDLGHAIRGYILDIHKFEKLWQEAAQERLYLFDLSFTMAQCLDEKEIRTYIPKKKKHAMAVGALHTIIERYLDEWIRRKVISHELAKSVRNLFQAVYLDGKMGWNINSRIEDASTVFPLVRIATMLTLHLEGYPIREIYEGIRVALGINVQIMAETAYYAEVASVLSAFKGHLAQSSELTQISSALYYGGIPYRMLPVSAKNLFTAADRENLIFIKRYYEMRKKNKRTALEDYKFRSMKNKIQKLPYKYQELMKNLEEKNDKTIK